MRALFPASFNPFHVGHADVLIQALQLFEKVILCQMTNPEKEKSEILTLQKVREAYLQVLYDKGLFSSQIFPNNSISIEIVENDLMVNVAKKLKCDAVIRGLRNSHDLQYEMDLLAWNKQLGLTIPCPMFLADQRYAHISSSALRNIAKLQKGKS